jgi:hypothetical protein
MIMPAFLNHTFGKVPVVPQAECLGSLTVNPISPELTEPVEQRIYASNILQVRRLLLYSSTKQHAIQ